VIIREILFNYNIGFLKYLNLNLETFFIHPIYGLTEINMTWLGRRWIRRSKPASKLIDIARKSSAIHFIARTIVFLSAIESIKEPRRGHRTINWSRYVWTYLRLTLKRIFYSWFYLISLSLNTDILRTTCFYYKLRVHLHINVQNCSKSIYKLLWI
jgi:hypothetical protein